MTEEPAFGAELGRLARAVGHGPDFQILIVEAVADEATRMAREAIDHVAEERGLRVAEVCWDPAADAEGLERLIVAAASDVDLIHLSGASDWLTPERWQGLNIRRDRLAESARARLVWWLHPRNVAEMATQAPDLWAWRGGVYSFLDVASPSVSPLTSFDFPHEAWVNRADPGPRRKRIREIRTWLEGAPQPELVYEVAREWGDLALSLGEFDEARHAYRDIALPAARLHHTSREVLAMKDALATVASEAGDFGGVRRVYLVNQRALPDGGAVGECCACGLISRIGKARALPGAALNHHGKAEFLQLGNGGGGAGNAGFASKGFFGDAYVHRLVLLYG